MNPMTRSLRGRIGFGAAVTLLMALCFGGSASAMYLNDAARPGTVGHPYINPSDGFCVSGIALNGTMTVVPGITNYRDCVAYTNGLTGMRAVDVTATYGSSTTCCTTGATGCTNTTNPYGVLNWVAATQKCWDTTACTVAGGTGNTDSAKHTYSTSLCINPTTFAGISRVDLDNTAANCQEKGGVLSDGLYGHPYGACSAYGWIWAGVLGDGTAPLPAAGPGKGVGSDGRGFCYLSMRMNSSATPPLTIVTCPSQNNISLVCTGGTNAGKVCTVATQATACPGAGGGTCAPNAGWAVGTYNDGVLYQSQASYDAGLGWSFSGSTATPPNECLYQYGVKGYLATDTRGVDGKIATLPLCAGGTGAGLCVGGTAAGTACSDNTPCTGGGTCSNAGICVDLTQLTTQGDCLAAGGNWDNWLPTGNNAAPYATNVTPAAALVCAGGTNAGKKCTVATQGTDCPGAGGGTCSTFGSLTNKKLDATTSILTGGGKFYSGTGAVCLKCHSDQSRQTVERYKPGYVETAHKLAGEAGSGYTTIGDPWGLKGVQCEICHATGKPTAQDLGTIIYQTKVCIGGTAAGTACVDNTPCTGGGLCTAGVPRAASGHNQTEYGTHVTGVCYTCHGTSPADPAVNPASVIPVSGGDFAANPTTHLAPIANEFLNSPHAKYMGTSNKLDIITKTNYLSSFGGNICRGGSEVTDAATSANGVDVTSTSTCGGVGTATCNSATNCPLTPGGNRFWNAVTLKCYDRNTCTVTVGKTWDATTLRCVESKTTCEAQSDSGYNFVWSPTGVAGNPSIITATGAGCYRVFGSGTIYASYYDTGSSTARRIPNLDTFTNTACSSPTTGAGAFWTADGETAGTTGGVAFPATDGGNCMTCHDVHWSLASTDPRAEPIRRECTTCHAHTAGDGGSASNAPQISLTHFNHPTGTGTPLEHLDADPNEACETCHMPKSSATGSPMHLWRINTTSTYATMGTTQANKAADGAYADASWVDIQYACGQCHGGGNAQGAGHQPVPPALYRTASVLASFAAGMHPPSALPGGPPTIVDTFTPNANTWTLAVADASSAPNGIGQEVVNWGDGSVVADDRVAPFGPFSHQYVTPGTYTVTHKVLDTAGQQSIRTSTVVWGTFSISGTVRNTANTLPLPGVTVTVTSNATGLVAGASVTSDTGAYAIGSLTPGAYTVSMTLAGYTFPAPSVVTVGGNQVLNINSTSPALAPSRPPRLKKNPVEAGNIQTVM